MLTAAIVSAVPLDWYSNLTTNDCIVEDSGDPESCRLGGCNSGVAVGSITLPSDQTWLVRFRIEPDEDPGRDPDEYVDVYINSNFVGRYVNDPAYPFQHSVTTVISSNVLDYRFEFSSSNSDEALHIAVLAGCADSVSAVPLNWFSGLTTNTCIVEQVGDPGSCRLSTCTSGVAEGVISLPSNQTWAVSFLIQPDESPSRNHNDYVDVYIDSNYIGRYFNTPPHPFHHSVTALTSSDTVPYRFEFVSGNPDLALHMVVLPGLAVGVPETNCEKTNQVPTARAWMLGALVLILSGVAFATLHRPVGRA